MSIRGSVEGGRFAPDAHDMERDIRLLLHRVRKPAELAANPLAQSIAAALGFSDPVVAIRKVVDEAFSGESHDDVAMRSLVLRCDIDGSLSLSEACRAFAYSRRHFQRYRAQAVGTIARFVTQLLDPSNATNSIVHPLEGLADVVADHDPHAAAHIYALETGPLPAKSELTYLRSRVRAGEQLTANDVQSFSRIQDTLALALAAQSQEIAGNANDVTDLLSRLHYQASHASVPFDTATCFELEWLRFLQATHRSDTRALDASSRALARFAQEKPSLRPRALLAAAQASLHLGLLHDALDTVRAVTLTTYQERNVERLATATLLRAKIELCSNDAAMCRIELGRFWQIAFFFGLIFWSVLVLRALWPSRAMLGQATRQFWTGRIRLEHLLWASTTNIAALYVFGMIPPTSVGHSFTITDFWRW